MWTIELSNDRSTWTVFKSGLTPGQLGEWIHWLGLRHNGYFRLFSETLGTYPC